MDPDNCASSIRDVCKGKTSSAKDKFIFRDLDANDNIII